MSEPDIMTEGNVVGELLQMLNTVQASLVPRRRSLTREPVAARKYGPVMKGQGLMGSKRIAELVGYTQTSVNYCLVNVLVPQGYVRRHPTKIKGMKAYLYEWI